MTLAVVIILAVLAFTGWVCAIIAFRIIQSQHKEIVSLLESKNRLSEGRDRWDDKYSKPGNGIPATDLAGVVSPLEGNMSPGIPVHREESGVITLSDVEKTMLKMAPGLDEIISGTPSRGRDKNKSVPEYDSDEEFFKSLEDAPPPPKARATYSPPEDGWKLVGHLAPGQSVTFETDFENVSPEALRLLTGGLLLSGSPIFDQVKSDHPDLVLQ